MHPVGEISKMAVAGHGQDRSLATGDFFNEQMRRHKDESTSSAHLG